MATTAAQKFKIKPGFTIRAIDAPDNFLTDLQPLPSDVNITEKGTADQIHWFVKNKQELDSALTDVIKLVTGNTLCWIYYPKGSSGIQTDLTRDRGWDQLLLHQEFQWISLVSFNETWSAFAFRLKDPADISKAAGVQKREIFDYVSPATKEVKLPADLEAAIKDRPQWETFHKLSFSNKKEYIEWVITAKREETRKQRIAATLEKLSSGWKNPRNI